MKRNLTILGVLILLASACSPQPAAPTTNPQDVQHTAEAAAFTVVAQTQEAQPTNTPLPPAATVTYTPLPTLTSIVTQTVDPSIPTAIGLPTTAATSTAFSIATSAPADSSSNDCEKPLSAWTGPAANFTIKNETRPQGEVVLSLHVVSPRGDCGYLTDLSRGPIGSYRAGAFVNGQKNFKVFGSFQIQEGNWRIIIQNDKIVAEGS